MVKESALEAGHPALYREKSTVRLGENGRHAHFLTGVAWVKAEGKESTVNSQPEKSQQRAGRLDSVFLSEKVGENRHRKRGGRSGRVSIRTLKKHEIDREPPGIPNVHRSKGKKNTQTAEKGSKSAHELGSEKG